MAFFLQLFFFLNAFLVLCIRSSTFSSLLRTSSVQLQRFAFHLAFCALVVTSHYANMQIHPYQTFRLSCLLFSMALIPPFFLLRQELHNLWHKGWCASIDEQEFFWDFHLARHKCHNFCSKSLLHYHWSMQIWAYNFWKPSFTEMSLGIDGFLGIAPFGLLLDVALNYSAPILSSM